MTINLNITANNITYQEGDTLLVTFPSPFKYVASIDSISLDFSPLDTSTDYHDIHFRWTYDIADVDAATGHPNISWSAWEDYKLGGAIVNDAAATIQSMIDGGIGFDLQFRLVRRGPNSGARRVDRLVLEVTEAPIPEQPETSPLPAGSCASTYQDGDYVGSACATPNFCSGITIDCDQNLFRPYDVMGPGVALYKSMACAVSEMFGHCVRYFKVRPQNESADTILKEYSLFETVDVKDIKVMVPDNAFPSNAINYLPFDMDFEEGMELHIVREHFQRAFGMNRNPEEKDYLYFPLLDRMYEVHSAYLHRDFMMSEVYYKVQLYKWQDKENVMRNNPEIAEYVDNLTTNFEEILQPEIDREFEKITKPDQYRTISIGGFDHIRSLINQDMLIETIDLTNYFTVVGKYHYDMLTNMTQGDLAVKYKRSVARTAEQNTGFSMWFRHKKANFDPQFNTSDIILDGYNNSESKGYRFSLNYANNGGVPVTDTMTMTINQTDVVFDNLPNLAKDKWYGMVFNHMNEFSQATLHIWEMKYNASNPSQNKTTDLRLVYSKTITITPETVDPSNTYYTLRAGTYNVTNVRVWKASIEEEKQPILLNQYVVRDNDLTLLIDNAIPPLRMVREYVR